MRRRTSYARRGGYSVIELLVALAIMSTLTSIGLVQFTVYLEKARVARAIGDLDMIAAAITSYQAENEVLPRSLAEVGYDTLLDPWGHFYQYLNLQTAQGIGSARKDRFIVPLNSDYDLYSKGKDGDSVPPLTARVSRDDIIRANNGGYLGLAERY